MTESASAATEEQTATLSLRDVGFREAGGTITAALSLRTGARRLGLIGEWGPLFRALTGETQIPSGSGLILGCPVDAALARGVVGLALCDPALPDSFSVREYLEHAGRLSHGSKARAASDAQRTLEEYGLLELSARALGELALFQRRALGIALAALTGPLVLCLETPLCNLDAAAADYVARLCAHAAKRSRLIVSAALPSSPSPERTLLGECDELLLLDRGALLARGSPESVFAPNSRYLLTLVGSSSDALRTTLGNSGCRLTEQASPTTFAALLAPNSRVTRYLVELAPEQSADLLLDTALGLGITVLELEPLLALR